MQAPTGSIVDATPVEQANNRRLPSNGLVLLDTAYLYRQMGLRGINASQLAQASGLTQSTLSHISRGQPAVRPSTMEKLAKGLAKFPVIEGIDPLLIVPDDVAGLITGGHFSLRQAREMVGTHVDQPVERIRKARRPLWPNEGVPPEFVDGLRVIDITPKRTKTIAPVENNHAPRR